MGVGESRARQAARRARQSQLYPETQLSESRDLFAVDRSRTCTGRGSYERGIGCRAHVPRARRRTWCSAGSRRLHIKRSAITALLSRGVARLSDRDPGLGALPGASQSPFRQAELARFQTDQTQRDLTREVTEGASVPFTMLEGVDRNLRRIPSAASGVVTGFAEGLYGARAPGRGSGQQAPTIEERITAGLTEPVENRPANVLVGLRDIENDTLREGIGLAVEILTDPTDLAFRGLAASGCSTAYWCNWARRSRRRARRRSLWSCAG